MTNCPTCGIRFTPTPASPVYCSPACWPQVREERGAFRPDDGEIAATAAARSVATAKPKRRTRSERFATLNAFVDMGMAGLTRAEVKVWLILFRDTKANGTARTGQRDIARRAGLKPRMVRYALASLEAKGMLQTVRRGRLNEGPSIYRVHPTGNA
jgi:hypothetical protein